MLCGAGEGQTFGICEILDIKSGVCLAVAAGIEEVWASGRRCSRDRESNEKRALERGRPCTSGMAARSSQEGGTWRENAV